MKLLLTSDTHIDFFEDFKKTLRIYGIYEDDFLSFFETDEKYDAIVIAGDIGHFPEQNIEVLNYIKRKLNIDHIILTLGNHDYYLLGEQYNLYNGNSLNKEAHTIKLYESNGFHVMNGNIINIDGVSIAGYPSWYDGKYYQFRQNRKLSEPIHETIKSKYHSDMNDSRYVSLSIEEMFKYQRNKIKDLPNQKIDLFITHVQPFVSDELYTTVSEKIDYFNSFFMYDGQDEIHQYKPKYWLFGHTHRNLRFIRNDVEFICNPIGYPNEKSGYRPTIIEL
jgi:UDP-2,3-diacylglucosamine pyrophosphatase LpxH